MGAATATGGYLALSFFRKVMEERDTAKKQLQEGQPQAPQITEAHARLLATATGGIYKPPKTEPKVVKRTVIEEMMDEIDQDA